MAALLDSWRNQTVPSTLSLGSLKRAAAAVYVLAECVSYWRYRKLVARLSGASAPTAPSDEEYRKWLAAEILENHEHEPHESKERLELIFRNAPIESIPRHNLVRVMAHLLYLRSEWTLEELYFVRRLVADMEGRLETSHSLKLKHGYSHDLHSQTNLFGTVPMTCWYKPLAFYGFMWLYRQFHHLLLYSLGFRSQHCSSGLTFWLRLRNVDDGQHVRPVLFCHGLGIGVTQYVLFVASMCRERSMILVEIPNISYSKFVDSPPNSEAIAASIADMLHTNHIDKVDIIGHSYGTVVMTQFLHKHRHLVHKKVYADPACFFAGSHRTCQLPMRTFKQFVYKSFWTTLKNPLAFVARAFFWWFLNRDIWVQYLIFRRSWGNELFERGHNMDHNTLVILAENDELIPTATVRKYIQRKWGSKVSVLFHPADHATFCWKKSIWDHINLFLRDPSELRLSPALKTGGADLHAPPSVVPPGRSDGMNE